VFLAASFHAADFIFVKKNLIPFSLLMRQNPLKIYIFYRRCHFLVASSMKKFNFSDLLHHGACLSLSAAHPPFCTPTNHAIDEEL